MKLLRFLVLLFSAGVYTSSFATPNSLENNENTGNKDLIQFAKRIEASIQNDNPSYFTECFDINAFMLKIMGKKDTNDLEGFEKGFWNGFSSGFNPGANVLNEVGDKGTYTFLHAGRSGNQEYLLFRIINNNGINYHKYTVDHDKQGYKITDVFIFNSGAWLSEILGNVYQNFNTLRTPGNSQDATLTGMKSMDKIQKLATKGRYGRAYKSYKKLPDEIRQQHLFQIVGLRLASHLTNETYLSQYHKFIHNMPSNGGTYLVALQGFVSNKDPKMALQCIDSVDHYVGKDPMLNILRSNLYYQLKDYDQAESRLSNLIESMPDYENGYFSLLSLYLKVKDYSGATSLLDKMTKVFNYYKEDMQSLLKEYPDFIASKEYQAWLTK